MNSPLLSSDGSTLIPLEDVLKTRQQNTIAFSSYVSSTIFVFATQTTQAKYQAGLDINRAAMERVRFDREKLLTVLNKVINNYDQSKNDAGTIKSTMLSGMLYTEEYPGITNFIK